jgi:hypothetical protein
LIRRAAGPDDPYETFLTNANRPSDLPHLQITTVPPGTYRTACDRYFDACRDRVPAETVILTDGLVMRVLSEPTARFLHYWDGAAFQNILIAE